MQSDWKVERANQVSVPVQRHHPRTRSVAWAREAIADPTAVFLDTETTGLDRGAEIVDIGVVDVRGRVLLDTLIRPVGPIPAAASSVHGIYDHHVLDAPSWEQISRVLVPLLTNRRVVVFNADFDRRIVEQCCARLDMAPPPCVWECAMRAYADYAAAHGHRWHKLDRAAATFGIRPGGHRALADAEVCRQVVHRMATS
jgi:DNA polymerase-3 subunit epsilon